ncbi:MAG TPA: hypothetical protein VJ721_07340, partial [Chthoniobacterales bacterium]|nr:hypothetical protein [Chthoniobacterales bacterium]
MRKGRSLAVFCFALSIAFDCSFAREIEVVIKKAKPVRGKSSASRPADHYPWKPNIVTTVFWIGEPPHGHNLTPNKASAWDKDWTKNYGGFDDPNPARRNHYLPVKFTPRQNPFYC